MNRPFTKEIILEQVNWLPYERAILLLQLSSILPLLAT